ncbi:hypothetical protein D3C81_1664310 [compost metagenome]
MPVAANFVASISPRSTFFTASIVHGEATTVPVILIVESAACALPDIANKARGTNPREINVFLRLDFPFIINP